MKPTEIEVRRRVLSVCSHGNCEDWRIWDFDTCWMHLKEDERNEIRNKLADAIREGTSLNGVVLSGADLTGLDFTGVDLSESFLDRCDISSCKLIEANLERAFLAGADLDGCSLERANLKGTVFSGASLENASLLAYSLVIGRTPINLTSESFGHSRYFSRPKLDESDPHTTEWTYRSLKRYFMEQGDYDSASWATYCERLMKRKNDWRDKKFGDWLVSLFFGSIAGYGEKPIRVIIFSFLLIVAYSIAYYLLDIIPPLAPSNISGWSDSFYFSTATFSTFSFSDVNPKGGSIVRLLISSEAFVGIFVFGLFVFTLTKRYVAR